MFCVLFKPRVQPHVAKVCTFAVCVSKLVAAGCGNGSKPNASKRLVIWLQVR